MAPHKGPSSSHTSIASLEAVFDAIFGTFFKSHLNCQSRSSIRRNIRDLLQVTPQLPVSKQYSTQYSGPSSSHTSIASLEAVFDAIFGTFIKSQLNPRLVGVLLVSKAARRNIQSGLKAVFGTSRKKYFGLIIGRDGLRLGDQGVRSEFGCSRVRSE